MDKIRVGVIGAGKMGILHSGIFNSLDKSTLCAISDNDGFMVSVLNNYLPRVNAYRDYKEMMKKEDLDLAVITTPVYLHRPIIEDLIENNLSIFVEKPLAMNGEECKSLLGKSHRNKSLVGYCRRFMETYNLTKKIILSEELGKVNYFNSHLFVSQIFGQGKGWLYSPKTSGGGVLIDLGSHAIDLFHYIFGDILSVSAFAEPVFNKEVEDYASINLRLQNKIFGSLQVSWSIRSYRLPEFKIEIHLDDGVINVTEKYISIYSEVDANHVKKGWTTYYKQDLVKNIPINIAGPEYTLEDLHILDCILENRQTICDFGEAAKTNFILDKIYSSIESNKVEKISYEV